MDLEDIRALEQELLTSAARRNPERLHELLHPEFVEIGRSGTLWSRDEIVAALAGEEERAITVTDEWAIRELGPALALVTYVVRGSDRDSRHASIWSLTEGRLQMRFHQGTFVAVR